MADSASIVIMRANALKALKETGSQLAAQAGIEPPNLNLFYKDADYQQAEELAAIVAFHRRLLTALQTQSEEKTDGQPSITEIPQRRQHRAVVSERNTGQR